MWSLQRFSPVVAAVHRLLDGFLIRVPVGTSTAPGAVHTMTVAPGGGLRLVDDAPGRRIHVVHAVLQWVLRLLPRLRCVVRPTRLAETPKPAPGSRPQRTPERQRRMRTRNGMMWR